MNLVLNGNIESVGIYAEDCDLLARPIVRSHFEIVDNYICILNICFMLPQL